MSLEHLPAAGALALAALVLASTPALAESTSILTRVPTSGLDQPATSVALADGPEAITVNPAGLGFQRGFALRYLHETGPEPGDDFASSSGDGFYIGDRFFGFLGLGFATEWVRPKDSFDPSITNYRRTSWGLSLGGESLSLGIVAHVFTRGIVDDRTTWDLGLMTRPNRWMSFGFTVRDVDGPSFSNRQKIPRRYAAAIAARPIGDWLSLAVDGEVLGGENPAIDNGFDSMALAYTARARVLDGWTLLASLTHRLDAETPILIQAGLAIDTPALGIFGTPLIRTRDGSAGFLVGGDLRAYEVPGIDLTPRREVAVVDMAEALGGGGGVRLFPTEPRDRTLDFVMGLERIARDDRIGAVILDFRSLDLGMGRAFEIRRAIESFRESGKPIAAMLYGADDPTYFVASAADWIYVTPDAALFINGFTSSAYFVGGSLEFLGVEIDVARVGAYKNAPDALTRSDVSKEQAEVMSSLLDDTFPRYVDAVASSRDLEPGEFRALLDRGILTASEAEEGGLVDEILFPDELADRLAGVLGRDVRLVKTRLRPEPWTSWGPPPEIAIIPIEGTITAGRSSGGFIEVTGARTVVESIDAAANDPRVRAIVLRIDSGGGDAGGSQLIWRAVTKARKKKPVIASMSGAAASGGYFAAVGADRIFAAPDTITGSIGVFWIKPSFKKTLEHLKIGSHHESRGAQADIDAFNEPWTEAEQATVQRYVDSFYLQFIEAVAEGRGLEVDQVDQVARGRVWTGAQALERGLVDELGGYSDALLAARQAAGLGPREIVRHRVYGRSASLVHLSSEGQVEVDSEASVRLPKLLDEAIRAKIPAPLLVENPSGLWAVAPFTWKAR